MSRPAASLGLMRMIEAVCDRLDGSPRHHLKARGYRWSDGSEGRPKSWWIEVDEPDLEGELCYLRTEIYQYPEADPPTRYLTAVERFRA